MVPLLTASATITLIPVQIPISASSTLSVVTSETGIALALGQVPGRLLSTLTVSGERSVPTTGMGHEDAQAAHGTLTFYNAALYAQTIPAGTVLIGRDGVQVVTDTDAVIPAAITGNKRAGDGSGPCGADRPIGQHRSRGYLRPLLPGECASAKYERVCGGTERPQLSHGHSQRYHHCREHTDK